MRGGVLRADFGVRGGHAIFPDFFGSEFPAGEVEG